MLRNVTYAAAIVAAGLGWAISGAEAAPKGAITVWSWNVAAEALDSIVPDFIKKYPDV